MKWSLHKIVQCAFISCLEQFSAECCKTNLSACTNWTLFCLSPSLFWIWIQDGACLIKMRLLSKICLLYRLGQIQNKIVESKLKPKPIKVMNCLIHFDTYMKWFYGDNCSMLFLHCPLYVLGYSTGKEESNQFIYRLLQLHKTFLSQATPCYLSEIILCGNHFFSHLKDYHYHKLL